MTNKQDLFHNPVMWSRNIVGSPFRFVVTSGVHIFLGIMIVVIGGKYTFFFAAFATALSIYYLYALKRLLQERDREQESK